MPQASPGRAHTGTPGSNNAREGNERTRVTARDTVHAINHSSRQMGIYRSEGIPCKWLPCSDHECTDTTVPCSRSLEEKKTSDVSIQAVIPTRGRYPFSLLKSDCCSKGHKFTGSRGGRDKGTRSRESLAKLISFLDLSWFPMPSVRPRSWHQ